MLNDLTSSFQKGKAMEIVKLKNFLLISLYSFFIIIIYKTIFNQDDSLVLKVLQKENQRLIFTNDGLEKENLKLIELIEL